MPDEDKVEWAVLFADGFVTWPMSNEDAQTYAERWPDDSGAQLVSRRITPWRAAVGTEPGQ